MNMMDTKLDDPHLILIILFILSDYEVTNQTPKGHNHDRILETSQRRVFNPASAATAGVIT